MNHLPSIQTICNHFEENQKVFDGACDQFGSFLDQKPTIYKATIIAIHVFRAIAVFAMMEMGSFAPIVSLGILIPASLMYRAAVERFCTFRFTLPALVGGLAMWEAKQSLIALSAKSAFSYLSLLGAGAGIASLAGYLLFVCTLSHFDVEKRMLNLRHSCCV
jgi:hypothetical protein